MIKKHDLKSIITMMISLTLCFAVIYTIMFYMTQDLATSIIQTFLTIAVSVIGWYIGYQQASKKSERSE